MKVIEYQEDNKKFVVENQENKKKIVSRIGIRFSDEKIKDFKNRVDGSKILRNEYEEHIRFNHYIDNMDARNIEALPEEVINNKNIFPYNKLIFIIIKNKKNNS